MLTARLIERWFGPVFKLENVSCVLGFLGATAVGTLAAAVSGTAVVAIAEPAADILNVWRGWFTSAAWREVGGPRVDAPGKSSYGTSTIRDLIPYEFGGTVDLVFAPEGVRCRLELPSGWLTNAGEPTEAVAATAR